PSQPCCIIERATEVRLVVLVGNNHFKTINGGKKYFRPRHGILVSADFGIRSFSRRVGYSIIILGIQRVIWVLRKVVHVVIALIILVGHPERKFVPKRHIQNHFLTTVISSLS